MSVFILNDYWEVVCGEEAKPEKPTPPNDKVAEDQKYDQDVRRYEKDLKVWKKANNHGKAYLILLIEEGPKEIIKGMDYVADQYAKLIRLYGKTDLTTRDEALHTLSRANSSEYKSIQEYLKFLKKHLKTLEDMDFALPKWMEGTFLRLGLPEDLAPYIFQLIQTARANKVELDIDDMTVALSEHKKRVSNAKENAKAIAARFRKQDKPKGQGGGGKSNKNNKNKNKEKDKGPCDHCKGRLHSKSRYFYLQKDLRPDR